MADKMTERVTVRMTRNMSDRLQEMAWRLGVREVDVIRWAIAQVLSSDNNVTLTIPGQGMEAR